VIRLPLGVEQIASLNIIRRRMMAQNAEIEERGRSSDASLADAYAKKLKEGEERASRGVNRMKMGLITVATIVVAAIILYWWSTRSWESTDDAQIDGHINLISARVGGHIAQVNITDNQFVKRGTVLVEIDPADYKVALDRAEAEYEDSIASAEAARLGVPITSTATSSDLSTALARLSNAKAKIAAAEKQLDAEQAHLREAEANSAKAQSDLRRDEALVGKGIVSNQEYDQVSAAAKAASASVEGANASVLAAKEQVVQARGELEQAEAQLSSARTGPQQVKVASLRSVSASSQEKKFRSALDQARLNLDYTKVVAPIDGGVGKKSVEVGQNVQPGQVLLSIVPLDDIWVTANFKEQQLKYMRPGQPVNISVDAYGKKYDGHVDSIGAASGARFSLFPPENATGNFVKVVQRIPVKIVFEKGQDKEHLLRPGMSVVPEVKVK